MKSIRYMLEALLVWLLFGMFRLLGFERASAVGSWLACSIGPKLKVHQTAYRNLKIAFPRKREETLQKILNGMWDNLGRTVGEFVHVPRLTGDAFAARVTVNGQEHIDRLLKRKNQNGFMLFSAHLANWEIAPQTAFVGGYPLMLVYRPANNPHVDKMVQKSRQKTLKGMYPKGLAAAKQLVLAFKKQQPVGLLVDQKMNEGLPIPFFGQPAMTPTAFAEFAMKYSVPLIPARVVRHHKTQFTVEILPPLTLSNKTTVETLTTINAQLESWITDHPEQWFWVHKRWS